MCGIGDMGETVTRIGCPCDGSVEFVVSEAFQLSLDTTPGVKP